MISTEEIDKLIIGRVEPHIYAFLTRTIPNYLKIGDTYRPIQVRIKEWQDIFKNLEHDPNWEWLAKTENGKYFRDFAVHDYLVNDRHLRRLQPEDIGDNVYYSREFFENAKPEDICEAIDDINAQAAIAESTRYQFYSEEYLPVVPHYKPTEEYPPRPNQQEAIDAFIAARENGRRNLLMYAVMRFGKSFTSMCCAKAMEAQVVLIVSAKADVRKEWQKTVESHKYFADYVFLDSDALLSDNKAISNQFKENKRVAIFLTLQDLMGEEIKSKHKELFDTHIDLLIVDETHFGARASEYGRILRESGLNEKQIEREREVVDESLDELDADLEQIRKILDVDTTLHLSGTPYRILMGSEFKREDIIAFCQFTDIIDDKEEWDKQHTKDIDNEELNPLTLHPYQEWDNPYYGFPQMIRFAFNPNASAQALIKSLSEQGKTTALNELFRPQSISFDRSGKGHTRFVHETQVFDLLRAIDGSAEDENILSFLNYDKLKDGKMCRHMVFVLPFCASCDAMETLLLTHKDEFTNLKEYTIVNIAGVTNQFKTTDEIKQRISKLEEEGKKSITLTVNRMLTGSTVREWDTMLFLKDVSSPQEYDQAIFRLQNQYVTTYRDENDASIKYDMKPQTLLVDFDPNRMFRMQEQKSKIYNVNTEERGNEELEARIRRELEVSPIIVVNKDHLVQVTATNIMDAVREYSATRTVMEEANAIPVDMDIVQDPSLWDDIKNINPITASKGIAVKPVEGEGEDYDEPIDGDTADGTSGGSDSTPPSKPKDEEQRDKRLSTLFALILFYALLTDTEVSSLRDVIESIRYDFDNQRILRNLGIHFHTLIYLRNHLNPFVLSDLDYKIQTSNQLLKDETFEPIERVERASQKFGRMSESEIVTPSHVADQMVALLPDMNESDRILDIASKQGEFACALYRRFGDKIRNNVYSIPTSSVAYEFTRKVYRLLGMDDRHVFSTFTSYDLINENKESHINTLTNMNFSAVIGNPPYQEVSDVNNRQTPIYHYFYDVAERLAEIYALITPARFLFNAGLTPNIWNAKMLNDEHLKVAAYYQDSTYCFPDVNINGGVAIMMRNLQEKCGAIKKFIHDDTLKSIASKFIQDAQNNLSSIVFGGRSDLKFSDAFLEKYPHSKDDRLAYIQKTRPSVKELGPNEEYELKSSTLEALSYAFEDNVDRANDYYHILGLIQSNRAWKYIRREYMTPRYKEHNNIDKYKVFLSEADGAAGQIGKPIPARIIGASIVGKPGDSSTSTFISIGSFDSNIEAENCAKYMKTKLLRCLVGILKITQHITPAVFAFVPLQDFTSASDIDWSKSVAEIDQQLYRKYDLSAEEIAFIEKMINPMA